MLEALRKKMKIPEDRFPILVEHTGNTVSSTLPLALEQLRGEARLAPGTRAMLLGFGVGYSWAGCLLNC